MDFVLLLCLLGLFFFFFPEQQHARVAFFPCLFRAVHKVWFVPLGQKDKETKVP